MVKRIKESVLKKLSERLLTEAENDLAPETNPSKINCWACGKYAAEAEQCYYCSECTIWTLKKIFIHNRRYLRCLEPHQLHKMGFST